ncbi:MAG: lasso peptide biosynthesis B2 protein [Blastocatellia bacterium]
MKKLTKLLRLDPGELGTLAQAVILLPLTALALRLAGLRRSQRIFSRLIFPGGPHDPARKIEWSETAIAQALRISRLVSVAARHGVYPANCLQRSLALWWMLRRRGIESELQFGARKTDGRFEAHAWIEVAGVVLNDSDDVRLCYTPFDRAITVVEAGRR